MAKMPKLLLSLPKGGDRTRIMTSNQRRLSG
jgi:hypothetical protein